MHLKISANRLALVSMAGGRLDGLAASIIRLKFWLKFCFLTITQMFLNGNVLILGTLIDMYVRYCTTQEL